MGFFGKIADIIVLGSLAAAVAMNVVFLLSCEFFDFSSGRGTLGLLRYKSTTLTGGECTDISATLPIDDTALRCGRISAYLALAFGFVVLCVTLIHQYCCAVPFGIRILDFSGLATQLSLALVYVTWRTDVCKTFGCNWGQGALFLLITQALYLVASFFTRCMQEPRYVRNKDSDEDNNNVAYPPADDPESSSPWHSPSGQASTTSDSNNNNWHEDKNDFNSGSGYASSNSKNDWANPDRI